MQRHERNGLVWYTFENNRPPLRHALVTRLGGVSKPPYASLNLGYTVGDRIDAVHENHQRLFQTLHLEACQIVSPHQVHGARVVRVGTSDKGTIVPNCDALITDTPGVVLMMRFADCAPVLLYDANHHAIGLVHAGWRGTAAQIVSAAIEAMAKAFGIKPAELWAGIGPSIGGEHYAVGPEVVKAIESTLPAGTHAAFRREGQWYLDLPYALYLQLKAAGVATIEISGFDTAERTNEWYSHRAEQGRTGRFGALIWLET